MENIDFFNILPSLLKVFNMNSKKKEYNKNINVRISDRQHSTISFEGNINTNTHYA